MKNAIDPGSVLKITHHTVDELHLESGFSSFSAATRYELRESVGGIWRVIAFFLALIVAVAPMLRDAFAENPVDGQIIVVGIASASILATLIFSIVGYAFAQSWRFERSTESLVWTQKFLLGNRTKQYRLNQFVTVTILNPLKDFNGQYSLVLMRRRGWSLFPSGKVLRLMKIGTWGTPYLQARLAIHQYLAQEIAEFMDWSID